MKKTIFISFSIILLAGCASAPPLTAAEQEVRLLREGEPPIECKEISRVTAESWDDSIGNLETILRREGHKVGANLVQRRDWSIGHMNGVAFNCPRKLLRY